MSPDSETSEESHCDPERECKGCDRSLPSNRFHANKAAPSGLNSRCKDCKSDYSRRRHDQEKLDRKMEGGVQCDECCDEPAPVEDPPVKRPRMEPEHLYIMALSTDPTGAVHGLKVGRSGNIQQRANTLSESMPFNIIILATFPGAGYMEKRVHTMLDYKRNTTGRGREWFHVPLPTVIQMVGIAMELP